MAEDTYLPQGRRNGANPEGSGLQSGVYHVAMRRGISRLGSGTRTTLGIILHNAA